MNRIRFAIVLLPAALPILVGCGGGGSSIYQEPAGRALATSVSAKTTWTAKGDVQSPHQAIDGNLTTSAATLSNYTGAAITVDLQKPCLFQAVVIDHGPQENGFADRMEVSTSSDGQTFDIRYYTMGTRRITTALLPKPVLARYVRLRAVRAGQQPWNLAEIYLQ